MKEMMNKETYADLSGLIGTDEDDHVGMTCSDVLILPTRYRSALAKYLRPCKAADAVNHDVKLQASDCANG